LYLSIVISAVSRYKQHPGAMVEQCGLTRRKI